MKKALLIYHIVNLMHMLFYVYIMIRGLNIGNLRGVLEGNSRLLLIGYIVLIIALSYYAKKIGNGLENPMRTVKNARILHFVSLAVFVVAFVVILRGGENFIYLMLLSFPIDFFAFIIAYRHSQIVEKPKDLLDDLSDNKEFE